MTLNEFIKQMEEKANLNLANKNFNEHADCIQLVDWLKELKQRRTQKDKLCVQDQMGGCLLQLRHIKTFNIEECSELYCGKPYTEFDEQYPEGVTAHYAIVAHINSKLRYYMGLYLWCEDALRAMRRLTNWADDPDKTVFVFPPLEEMNPDLNRGLY